MESLPGMVQWMKRTLVPAPCLPLGETASSPHCKTLDIHDSGHLGDKHLFSYWGVFLAAGDQLCMPTCNSSASFAFQPLCSKQGRTKETPYMVMLPSCT